MRTTLDIDDDVLTAARDLSRRQSRTIGEVISSLARKALMEDPSRTGDVVTPYGFPLIPSRSERIVTNEEIDRIREEGEY
jgi:hypothetical protein